MQCLNMNGFCGPLSDRFINVVKDLKVQISHVNKPFH